MKKWTSCLDATTLFIPFNINSRSFFYDTKYNIWLFLMFDMSCHQTSLDARKCTMVICKMGGEYMNTGASRIRNNTVHD